jgi:hypothetical protein
MKLECSGEDEVVDGGHVLRFWRGYIYTGYRFVTDV